MTKQLILGVALSTLLGFNVAHADFISDVSGGMKTDAAIKSSIDGGKTYAGLVTDVTPKLAPAQLDGFIEAVIKAAPASQTAAITAAAIAAQPLYAADITAAAIRAYPDQASAITKAAIKATQKALPDNKEAVIQVIVAALSTAPEKALDIGQAAQTAGISGEDLLDAATQADQIVTNQDKQQALENQPDVASKKSNPNRSVNSRGGNNSSNSSAISKEIKRLLDPVSPN